MSARSTLVQAAIKGGTALGALFLVSVLLAAMPGHRAPMVSPPEQQESAQQPETDHSKMAGMDMGDEKASEPAAVSDMTRGMHHESNAHMTMTHLAAKNAADEKRAADVVADLRKGIEKYKDYRVALEDGYKIFLPNVPQPEYHFTSYKNAFLEAFTFDASRPTSLLYKKTGNGYELAGAMYTMPKRATAEQLNERVPLSVATWHLHTNLCMPAREQMKTADWTRFGLKGSIATQEDCDAAGGRFRPSIFGWMVHVYPYEDSLDKSFAMHDHRE